MAKHLGTNKDVEKLVRIARREGWDVEVTRGNHIRFKSPDKQQPIIIGSLTGSSGGIRSLTQQLKKAGVAA